MRDADSLEVMARPLVVIVGPTGIGKTALGIEIAQRFSGQIISADSRQIYQLMDIGTAKPTAKELAAVPHHLIDIVPPDYIFTLAEFQDHAYHIINAVHNQGDLPLLVGGTGQWVWAVIEGWGLPRVPPDESLRAELELEAEALGAEAFHAKLAAIDPEAAAKLDYRNVRRVIRAMEVYLKTGIPISTQQQKRTPPYKILQIGLTMDREQLYCQIDNRIDKMMQQGLLAEVEKLVALGYGFHLPSMSGLGYKELGSHLSGELTLDESVELIKRNTRRFIRQQYNWFRLTDERIHWQDVSNNDYRANVLNLLEAFCSQMVFKER